MAKIITFASGTGGVGKTTLCLHLGAWYGSQGHRTLVIDMNPTNQKLIMGLFNIQSLKGTLADGFLAIHEGKHKVKDSIVQVDNNLSIIPSSFSLFQLRSASPKTMEIATRELRGQYDYILIDTAPGWDNIIMNAYMIADLVVTPVTQEDEANSSGLVWLQNMIQTDLEKAEKKWRLLINKARFDDGHIRYENELLYNYGNILRTKVPKTEQLRKFIQHGKRLTNIKQYHRAYPAIAALAKEIDQQATLSKDIEAIQSGKERRRINEPATC